MDYRDERDALRGRVENLEQELGDAKRELAEQRGDDRKARIARVEQQMAEAQRLLEGLGTELAALKGAPAKRPSPATPIVVALALVVTGAGMAGFLLARAPAPAAVAVEAPVKHVEQDKPASPAPEKPAGAGRRVHAVWTGEVTKATGSAPPQGAACTVEATLRSANGSISAVDLTVSCGGSTLYRSTDKLEGMSMNGSQGEERAGAEAGSVVYALAYDDKGTRSGARNEVSLDTNAGVGSVWRTSVPAFHVDFSVAKQSAPVKGEALAR